MAQVVSISSLNAGELSPRLDGRVDKEFYSAGGRTVENMLPVVQGPLVQRSGSKYMGTVKNSANRTALVPFEFSTTQAYDLEFGDLYMRVWKNDALVLSTSTAITAITQANPGVVTANAHGLSNGDRVFISGVVGMVEVNNREFTVAGAAANTFQLSGVNTSTYGAWTSGGTVGRIYEIVTPYTQANLFDSAGILQLQFAQTADVMYLVDEAYAPRKLSRSGDAAWTLETVTFINGPFAQPNGDDTQHVFCVATGSNLDPGDSVTITSNADIFASGHVGGLFYVEERYFGDNDVVPYAVRDLNPNAVLGDEISSNGNVYEVTQVTGATFQPHNPWSHLDGDQWDSPPHSNRLRARYLHSRWCVMQISAYTDAKNVTATLKTRLPTGINVSGKSITATANVSGRIRITSNAHGYGVGDYVSITGVTGTTEANGSWRIINIAANTFELEGSTYVNAYVSGGTVKRYATWKWRHGAFSDARGYPSVVSFFEERLVLAATTSQPDSVWLSCSGDYERFQIKFGSEITADAGISVTLAQGQVNKITWATPTTDGLILGTSSSEFLLGPAQTTTALAPDNVKAVRVSDFGSRAVQPHRGGPGVTFFVQSAGRKIRNLGGSQDGDQVGSDLSVRADHLTRRSPIIDMAYTQEPNPILWAVRQDGRLLSFTFEREQSVFGWASHPLGGFSNAGQTAEPIVESISQIPSADGLSDKLTMIVQRYINGATFRTIETLMPLWVDGDAVADAFMVDCGLVYSGSAVTTISGLFHLVGQSVSILADGRVHPMRTVSSAGTVTLDYSASKVAIGLPMRARFETMRMEAVDASGSGQGKQKRVVKAAVRVAHTNQFRYGRKFTDMKLQDFGTQADTLDAPPALVSVDRMVDWPDDWQREKRMCFENTAPVPFQLVAIFPALEVINA